MARLWLLIALVSGGAALVAPPILDLQEFHRPIFATLAAISLLLWLRAKRKGRNNNTPARSILIDGSNVMHWNNAAPDIAIVQTLVKALVQNGYTPGVIFDANAGYKLVDRYLDDAPLANELGLPEDQVLVVPRGTPADQFLLQAARDMDAPIITNDRFRDWVSDFPELSKPGRLIQGGYRNGAPYLKSNLN